MVSVKSKLITGHKGWSSVHYFWTKSGYFPKTSHWWRFEFRQCLMASSFVEQVLKLCLLSSGLADLPWPLQNCCNVVVLKKKYCIHLTFSYYIRHTIHIKNVLKVTWNESLRIFHPFYLKWWLMGCFNELQKLEKLYNKHSFYCQTFVRFTGSLFVS